MFILTGVAALSVSATAATWNLAEDFPVTQINPNGVWSYGWWDGALVGFTLYDSFTKTPAGEPRIDNFHQNGDLDSWGNVGKADQGETFTRSDWPHGMHFIADKVSLMSPTVDSFNRIAAAGFTAPAAGEYRLAVTFKNNSADGDVSRLLVIGQLGGVTEILHEAEIYGFGEDESVAPESFHHYARTISLGAGDSIYFGTTASVDALDPRWHHVGVEAEIEADFPAGSLQFSTPAPVLDEGDDGTQLLTVTVARSGGSSGAVGIDYAVTGGTATSNEDYTAFGGTLSWADGDSAPKSFTVEIRGDRVFEPQETIEISLINPSNGAGLGSPATAVVTIRNDDLANPGPVWSLNGDYPDHYSNPHSPWVFGWWEGGYSTFTLYNSFTNTPAGEPRIDNFHQNGNLDNHGNVGYADGGETFTRNDWPHGMHFVANTTTLMTAIEDVFNRVTSAGFVAPEAGEYQLSVTFKNNNADGDISRVQVLSHIGGVAKVVDEAEISGFGDEATAPESFHRFSGTFTLAAGDGLYLAHPAHEGATDPRWHHAGVDAVVRTSGVTGVLQFTEGGIGVQEGDVGGQSLTLTVSRTESSTGAISVQYATADVTATAGEDYTAASGTLTWADGDNTPKTITVMLAGDTVFETDETFRVSLSNPTGGAGIGGQGSATITLRNDDLVHPGPVWNLNEEFPASYSNPHLPWVFGFWNGDFSTFTLYNSFTNTPAGEARIDNFHHNGNLDSHGNVGYGDGGETFTRTDWPHGMHFQAHTTTLMTPDQSLDQRLTSAGFIAREPGRYQIEARFKNNNADGDISRVVVLAHQSGVPSVVDEASIQGFGNDEIEAPESVHAFRGTFLLGAGDGVYFVQLAHPEAVDARYHHVGLEAVVSSIAGPDPVSPAIAIAATPSGISITFQGVLQVADEGTLTGWKDVAGAASPYEVPASGAIRFWRARAAR
jgi:hypothetical protein